MPHQCQPSSPPPSHAQKVLRRVKHIKKSRKMSNDELEPYLKAARWISLAINPYVNLTLIFFAGISEQSEEEDEEEYTEEELLIYEDIMKLVPTFDNVVMEFRSDPGELGDFIAAISAASSAARQEDTSSLKYNAIEYILHDPLKDVLNPPITRSHVKSFRGFNHEATARLLCPMSRLAEFDRDPSAFMEHVNDGTLKIRASEWPLFMYNEIVEWDPNNIDNGLCEGFFLGRVLRHIFTGPSSAISTRRKAAKASKAQIHGMTEVTGRHIAYAAIQARFVLCSSEQWSRFDSNFDSEDFYNNIVDLYETDPSDQWVTENLARWQKQVPDLSRSLKKRKRSQHVNPDSGDDEAINTVLAQRQARRRLLESEQTQYQDTATSRCAAVVVRSTAINNNDHERDGHSSPCHPSRSDARPLRKNTNDDRRYSRDDEDEDDDGRQLTKTSVPHSCQIPAYESTPRRQRRDQNEDQNPMDEPDSPSVQRASGRAVGRGRASRNHRAS